VALVALSFGRRQAHWLHVLANTLAPFALFPTFIAPEHKIC
jgi:hypothetical protein